MIAEVPLGGADLVDEAVGCGRSISRVARNAAGRARAGVLPLPATGRGELRPDLPAVSREHGKTLVEARGSVFRGLENVEYACGIPSLLMGDTLENIARGVDCETMLQPLGVCVGITPFNFPAMVPLWMFPLALACGNTFVLKPSEKVPLTAVLLVELLEQAGLPKGVLNIVHGGREVRRCAAHASEGARDFLRRLDADRAIHLRNRHEARQTRAGQRRREELHRHHAGRRRAEDRRSAFHRGVRLRRRTLHGGLDRASPSAQRRSACCPSLVEAARAIKVGPTDVARRSPTWDRSSPRNIAIAC